MNNIQPGQRILVKTAGGDWIARVAASEIEAGDRFPIVWVCKPEEWQIAKSEQRDPEVMPWPADAIREEAG